MLKEYKWPFDQIIDEIKKMKKIDQFQSFLKTSIYLYIDNSKNLYIFIIEQLNNPLAQWVKIMKTSSGNTQQIFKCKGKLKGVTAFHF